MNHKEIRALFISQIVFDSSNNNFQVKKKKLMQIVELPDQALKLWDRMTFRSTGNTSLLKSHNTGISHQVDGQSVSSLH